MNNNRLSVAHIIPTFSPREGGAQTYIHTIANNLVNEVKSFVVTRKYVDTQSHERIGNVSVTRYSNPMPEKWKSYATGSEHVKKHQKYMVALVDAIWSIKVALNQTRAVDIIHLHFPIPLGLAAIICSKVRNIPLIVTVHGNADIYEGGKLFYPLIKGILSQADFLTVPGQELKNVLNDELGVKGHIEVLPPAVDLARYSPSNKPNSNNFISLITVGRLMPRKNLGTLIEGIQMANLDCDYVLRIVGSGPDLNRLTGLVQNSNRSKIIFTGFVSENSKIEMLRESDLFIQPSLSEGFSRSTVEALSCGVPALVSDAVGVREPVIEGTTGLYIDNPSSSESVKSALELACASRTRLAHMGDSARTHSMEEFSEQSLASKYLKIYQSMLH